MTMTVYYNDAPFVIKADNKESALIALKNVQLRRGKTKLDDNNSIQKCTDIEKALEILELRTSVDEFGSVFVKEIDKYRKPKGMLTDSRVDHCKYIFRDAIGKYAEGVFSFVEREGSMYRKHRYKDDTYECITMNVAIYDSNDIKNVKKLAEDIIYKAVQLGTSEEEIKGWVKNSFVDLVMDA